MPNNEKQWSSATPGLLIILIDQSGSMLAPYEGNDSRTVFATRAVNRVIDEIINKNFNGDEPKNRCFISVIGYNHTARELTSGWLKELDQHPLRVDTVTQKISDGAGGLVEIPRKMPIWVEPVGDGLTNMKASFELAKNLCEQWIKDKPDCPAPVIINISDGLPYYDGKNTEICMNETESVVKQIMDLQNADGNVLVFNAEIGQSGQTIEFPSSCSNLTDGAAFLYRITSLVPKGYMEAAIKNDFRVEEGSRACIFHADGVNLIKLIDFGSSRAHHDANA